MGKPGADALEVLRDLWRSQAQTDVDLGDDCETRRARRCPTPASASTTSPARDEADRSAAWRARLEREGKLGPAGSLRDLILPPDSTDAG